MRAVPHRPCCESSRAEHMGVFAHYTNNMRSALQRVVSVTAVPLLLIAAVSSPGTRSSQPPKSLGCAV